MPIGRIRGKRIGLVIDLFSVFWRILKEKRIAYDSLMANVCCFGWR